MEGLVTVLVLAFACIWWFLIRKKTLPLKLSCNLEGEALVPFSSFTFIERPQDLKDLVTHLMTQKAIGVDVEHSSQSYKGEVCLIQISSTKDFIVDALALKDHIQTLKPVFEAESIVKVLHGAYNDVKWLYENFGFKILSLYDTQEAHKLFGHKDLGLDKLWSKYCEHSMDRSHKKEMQSSDWTLRPLSSIQLNYAATDSHFLLYLRQVTWNQLDELQRVKLLEKCQEISNSWALTDSKRKLKKYEAGMDSGTFLVLKELLELREGVAKAEDVNPRRLVTTKALAELASTKPENFEDYDFPLFHTHSAEILKILKAAIKSKVSKNSELTRKEIKQKRFEQFVERFAVKKDIYENCKLLAPDGEVLCCCDKNKANWYISKGLGVIVGESPFTVQLNFEPNGRGFSDLDIDQSVYLKEKHNMCVVCGNTGFYQRYHVVPLLYRQYFPLEHKSHRSHDIVLLCPKCHVAANTSADKLTKMLSTEFNVPYFVQSDLQQSKLDLLACSKRAKILVSSWDILSPQRKSELIGEIKESLEAKPLYLEYIANKFGTEWADDKQALEFLSIGVKEILTVHGDISWKKVGSNMHGKLVVDQLTDFKAFSRRWRRYFVDELKPQYLSDAWKADMALNSQ
mmetsp:Transcript_8199/g.16144  ORF Transcript_8199/g.16144 Transcript_8199/m.16144 type:complete len:628 (+) Transcript_8199:909-2792(+)